MSDLFGGYNPFGQDDKLVDPFTLVKNLKFNKLELREKIYVDKPTQDLTQPEPEPQSPQLIKNPSNEERKLSSSSDRKMSEMGP